LRKKIRSERSERGRFFFSKPVGPGLDVKGLVQKFCNKKPRWNFYPGLSKSLQEKFADMWYQKAQRWRGTKPLLHKCGKSAEARYEQSGFTADFSFNKRLKRMKQAKITPTSAKIS